MVGTRTVCRQDTAIASISLGYLCETTVSYSCRQPFVRVGFAICGDVHVNVGWLRNCIVIIK